MRSRFGHAQEAAAIAGRADVKGLYIDCLGATAPVYEKNGWKVYVAGSWGQRLGRYASSDKMMLRMTAEPKVGTGRFRRLHS